MGTRRDNGDGHLWEDKARGWRGAVRIHGRMRYVSASTKRELTRRIATLKAEAGPTGYTVLKAADEWMENYVSTCRPSTIAQYRQMLDRHILPVIGAMQIEAVLPKDIQAVVNGIHLSAWTTHHAHKVMSGLFKWMLRNRMIASTPVEGIRLPPLGQTTRRSMSSEEIAALLGSTQHSRWQNSVRFLLLTGLRRGELLALKWEDIHDGYIVVERSRSPEGVEGPPKSLAGIRRIVIGKALQGILDAQEAMLHIEGVKSSYIFPSESGTPVMPNTYLNMIHRFARKVGIHISVHELRHTFVSISAKGVDLHALQSILGHTRSTVTLDIYRHMIEGEDKAASSIIDANMAFLAETAPQSAPGMKKRAPG